MRPELDKIRAHIFANLSHVYQIGDVKKDNCHDIWRVWIQFYKLLPGQVVNDIEVGFTSPKEAEVFRTEILEAQKGWAVGEKSVSSNRQIKDLIDSDYEIMPSLKTLVQDRLDEIEFIGGVTESSLDENDRSCFLLINLTHNRSLRYEFSSEDGAFSFHTTLTTALKEHNSKKLVPQKAKEQVVEQLQNAIKSFNTALDGWHKETGCRANFGWKYGLDKQPKEMVLLSIDAMIYRPPLPEWAENQHKMEALLKGKNKA